MPKTLVQPKRGILTPDFIRERGFSMRGLARVAGVHHEAIRRPILDENRRVNLDDAKKIATALGLNVWDLYMHPNGDPVGRA